MKIAFITLLLLGTLVSRAHAVVVASQTDIVTNCGTSDGGPVTVTYTNSNPATNKVAKISGPKNKPTCVATDSGSGVFTITDVRTNCDITQPDLSVPEYWLQLTVQEYNGIYQNTDPTFLIRCSYSVSEVPVSTVIADTGNVGIPTIVDVETTGNPDMAYSIKIVDSTLNPIGTAQFGQTVFLQVSMNGTDNDEQGVRVKSCNVSSGGIDLPIIEDFCVVPDKAPVFQLSTFVSPAADQTTASFPIILFALEGSSSDKLEFSCTVDVCASTCEAITCPATAGKRKRRAAGNEAEEKSVKMATKIEILPIAVATADNQSQTGQLGSSSTSCMQSLGFIITVAVLAVLLLVAMVAVVFMFTTRRRELQKSGA